MMNVSPPLLYCNSCGAANKEQATQCFACGEPVHALVKETLLKQRYRLLGPIGQGGFGVVYKAEDTQCGDRLVAIKEINLGFLTAQEVIEATDAFNREVLLLSGLTHPNLPQLYDHFADTTHWYLVSDFIAGETLERYLNKTRHRYLPLEEVLGIGIQLCTVLDYLHTREPPIIFRDLKPANIIRTSNGHLYLIDFGIARRFKPGQARDTIALGSPGYAAPEQYGKAQTTPRADIYSLGATLHHLLTGNDPTQKPFCFAPVHLQNQSTPDRLQSLLVQMVEMDVNKRPVSIATVKQELEQIAAVSQPRGTILSTYHNHAGLVLALSWAPDGSHIVSGSSDGTIHVWNAASGHNTFIHRNPFKGYAWACALAWSADGTHIASGSDDKTVHVWQVGSIVPRNQVGIYHGHSRWVVALAWSPDGRYIASGANDATVHVWDVATKETVLIFRGHSFGVNALAWSPDGTRIASCCWDNLVRVWDVATGNTVFIYHGHSKYVNALAWSPDGTRIASASNDKTVQVWDAATGTPVFTYRGHSRWVYAVAWSPDGIRIASAGTDKSVQVWQAV
jgi:eukaryotic-like serine/threonine-protein kinase